MQQQYKAREDMIDLAAHFSRLDHHIRLNAQFRSDLHSSDQIYNGGHYSCQTGMDQDFPAKTLTAEVVSDALGSWGCGALHSSLWFHYQWPESWQSCHKEMVPIVFAVAIWGSSWSSQRIRCKSDNSADVAVVNTAWISPRPSANAHATLSLAYCNRIPFYCL